MRKAVGRELSKYRNFCLLIKIAVNQREKKDKSVCKGVHVIVPEKVRLVRVSHDPIDRELLRLYNVHSADHARESAKISDGLFIGTRQQQWHETAMRRFDV